jgi:hypothetical protein
VIVRIVDERDVDAVQPEAAQAGFQAPPNPVGAEVNDPGVRGRHRETLGIAPIRWRLRAQEPANLGGDHIVVPAAVP